MLLLGAVFDGARASQIDAIVIGSLAGLGDVDVSEGKVRARSVGGTVDIENGVASIGNRSIDVVNSNSRDGQGTGVVLIAGAQVLAIAIMGSNNDRIIDISQLDVIVLDVLDVSCGMQG